MIKKKDKKKEAEDGLVQHTITITGRVRNTTLDTTAKTTGEPRKTLSKESSSNTLFSLS